jgi:hypothetical protein
MIPNDENTINELLDPKLLEQQDELFLARDSRTISSIPPKVKNQLDPNKNYDLNPDPPPKKQSIQKQPKYNIPKQKNFNLKEQEPNIEHLTCYHLEHQELILNEGKEGVALDVKTVASPLSTQCGENATTESKHPNDTTKFNNLQTKILSKDPIKTIHSRPRSLTPTRARFKTKDGVPNNPRGILIQEVLPEKMLIRKIIRERWKRRILLAVKSRANNILASANERSGDVLSPSSPPFYTPQTGWAPADTTGQTGVVYPNVRAGDTTYFIKSPEATLPGAESSSETSIFASFEGNVEVGSGLHTDEDERVFC